MMRRSLQAVNHVAEGDAEICLLDGFFYRHKEKVLKQDWEMVL